MRQEYPQQECDPWYYSFDDYRAGTHDLGGGDMSSRGKYFISSANKYFSELNPDPRIYKWQ